MVALNEQCHHQGAKARNSRRRRGAFGCSCKSPTASVSSVNSVACNYYLLQDLLFRAVALTNSSGQIVEAYDCEVYGSTLIFTAPDTSGNWWGDAAVQSSNGANETIYCGYRFDPETQLYYVRNRTYNPVLGRWLQRDPIGYEGGINLYGYVESSPVGAVEPSGLKKFTVKIAGLGSSLESTNGEYTMETLPPAVIHATIKFTAEGVYDASKVRIDASFPNKKGTEDWPWILSFNPNSITLGFHFLAINETEHFKFKSTFGPTTKSGPNVVQIGTLHVKWYSVVSFQIAPNFWGIGLPTLSSRMSTHLIAKQEIKVRFTACKSNGKASVKLLPQK